MTGDEQNPLPDLDAWDEDVRRRYMNSEDPASGTSAPDRSTQFRDYESTRRDCVHEFYRQNHLRQTVDFVRSARQRFLPCRTRRMGLWEAMEFLEQLVDDSDPDIELPQIAHAIQTAEAIRQDGHPDWFVVTGLVHDMGKVLCLFDEPQWAVTGDTFPVGCRYSEKIVHYDFFRENPDWNVAEYQTQCGIYEEHCGLDQVMMSWGHDEYLYQVMNDYLPIEAGYMIRYHSFYACHREREYEHLMNQTDREMFRWVRRFNRYDLYTKSDESRDWKALLPEYQELTQRFFPETLWW